MVLRLSNGQVSAAAAHDRTGRRRLQTVLDGVFERCQHDFDVWWHVAPSDHDWPEFHRGTGDERPLQPNVTKIVV